MALPVIQFQPETFAQANPMLMGLNAALNTQQNYVKAQMAMPMAQQNLLRQQLSNQVLQSTANFAPSMNQAKLNAMQMQAPYIRAQMANIMQGKIPLQQAQAQGIYQGAIPAQQAMAAANYARVPIEQAQAGLIGQQSNLLGQTIPYQVQAAQGRIYTDPILQRLYQMNKAQQTGAIPQQSLNQLGMIGMPATNQAPMQNGLSPLMNTQGVTPNPTTTPQMFGGNPSQNWAIFGSPLNPLQMMQLHAMGSGMQTQAQQGVTQYNTAQAAAAQDATLGNQMKYLVNQFQANYAKTKETGPFAGRLPAVSGVAQAADNASQNLAALVAKTIAGGRVTNYEMQYVGTIKPNRMMTPQTAQMASDFLKQKAVRMQEYNAFLNAARAKGMGVQTAQTLWNKYNNQRPVYDFQTNQPNTQFQNTWNQFLTPQAVQAAQTGMPYVPLPKFSNAQQFKAWLSTIPTADRQAVLATLPRSGGK